MEARQSLQSTKPRNSFFLQKSPRGNMSESKHQLTTIFAIRNFYWDILPVRTYWNMMQKCWNFTEGGKWKGDKMLGSSTSGQVELGWCSISRWNQHKKLTVAKTWLCKKTKTETKIRTKIKTKIKARTESAHRGWMLAQWSPVAKTWLCKFCKRRRNPPRGSNGLMSSSERKLMRKGVMTSAGGRTCCSTYPLTLYIAVQTATQLTPSHIVHCSTKPVVTLCHVVHWP